MATRDDVEGFIGRLNNGISSEEAEPGIWVLTSGDDAAPLLVSYDPPVVLFRADVMDLPPHGDQRTALMTRLLQLNADDLVHGSYGIEGDRVILSDALELEDLGFSEFQSSVESISLALASHMGQLASYKE